METIGDTTPFSWHVQGPGTFTVTSNNGVVQGSMATYTFNNDISNGAIGDGIVREQNLIKSQHIKLDDCIVVDGTHQGSYGGAWIDYGTPELHTGVSQMGAQKVNMELYTLLCQYPDRDDGQPLFNPLPNLSQNLEKAEKKVTGAQQPMVLPTISDATSLAVWVATVATTFASNLASNKAAQVAIAAQMTAEDLARQIKQQEEYLTDKYGEEIYKLLFKAQVEAGAVYFKEELPYTITKEDLYNAALSEGKAEKRAAWLKRVG